MFKKKKDIPKKEIKTEINGVETEIIEGKHYWTITNFMRLTSKKKPVILRLIATGNFLREHLDVIRMYGRVFIKYDELFSFPFTITRGKLLKGNKVKVEKFYLDEGNSLKSKIEVVQLEEER